MLGAVGAVGAQPDQPVEGVTVLVVGVEDLVAGLGPVARDPVVAGLGQVVEPLDAEVLQVGQEQALGGQPGEQGARGDLVVLVGVLAGERQLLLVAA